MCLNAKGSSGLYLHAAKDLRQETRDISPPAANEVQVAVRSTTLCGSDLHYYSHFRNGSILVQEPLCLGHESAGEIVAIGSAVAQENPRLQVGARVALEVGIPCENCDLCISQRYNLCQSLRFRSSGSKFPHYQGTLQERINHPAKWVYELPPELDLDTGALLEPLAVAIQAVKRSELISGSSVGSTGLVIGAGAVGLLCSLAAQAAGFSSIVMSDIDSGRLDFALKNGFAHATYLVNPRRVDELDEKLAITKASAQEISEIKLPNGNLVGKVNTTFECTGVESSSQTAIYATKSGGTVVLAGLGVPTHCLPISEASAREISLLPTWRYANAYPKAIELAIASVEGTLINNQKLPDLRKTITHRFSGLEGIEEAFQTAGKGRDDKGALVVKTVVNFPSKM